MADCGELPTSLDANVGSSLCSCERSTLQAANCPQIDWAFRCLKLRSVENTAASNDNSYLEKRCLASLK